MILSISTGLLALPIFLESISKFTAGRLKQVGKMMVGLTLFALLINLVHFISFEITGNVLKNFEHISTFVFFTIGIIASYQMFKFSKIYGIKGSAYYKKVMAEQRIAGFFKEKRKVLDGKTCKRIIFTVISLILFVGACLLIMSHINGLTNAKWYDDGLDMINGCVLIFLAFLIFCTYTSTKSKNMLWVAVGFFIAALSRIGQVYLQELQLKMNYTPPLVWQWALCDVVMVSGFIVAFGGIRRILK